MYAERGRAQARWELQLGRRGWVAPFVHADAADIGIKRDLHSIACSISSAIAGALPDALAGTVGALRAERPAAPPGFRGAAAHAQRRAAPGSATAGSTQFRTPLTTPRWRAAGSLGLSPCQHSPRLVARRVTVDAWAAYGQGSLSAGAGCLPVPVRQGWRAMNSRWPSVTRKWMGGGK